MNSYTSNFKFVKVPSIRSVLIALSLLTGYHFLVLTEIIRPVNGTHPEQGNFVRIQRYVYQESLDSNIVLTGSSLTANIPISNVAPNVINLGMSGGCSQTGVEAVRRKYLKPKIILLEINGTIRKKLDIKMIDSIYSPFAYYSRLYLPMLRQEYQPFNILLLKAVSLKHQLMNEKTITKRQEDSNKKNYVNPNLTNKLILQAVEANQKSLNKKEEDLLEQEAFYLKYQISQLKRDGIRVILFNVPGEQRVQTTIKEKQIQALIRKLFPNSEFEWLPEPPLRHWRTSDGIHLVASDAKDYALFLKNQLLHKN